MVKELIEQTFIRVIGTTEVTYIKKNNWIEFTVDTNDVRDDLAIIQFKAKDWDRSTIIIFELFYNITKDRFEYDDNGDVIAFNTWEEFKQDISEIETIKSYVDLMYD
jgi:hypothetical protein